MFYKYCGMTGALVPSTQLAAYQPQGLTPYSGRVSQILFDSAKTKTVGEPEVAFRGSAPARGAAPPPPQSVSIPTTGSGNRGIVPATQAYSKIVALQNLMTKNDGKLVWQMFGRDRGMYIFTLGLSAIGTIMTGVLLYKLSFPQKPKD
ncbi:uncharacterized protein LOC124137080 [Haliotis rufescens]|uniref:uncharacterized protein LOC124137080 n=1 Tax=Haliotis rufescens TaxID=6454 RepID=UPI001EB0548B|nr:uncharacterized protein LOC124137080 [Haliotis rufescens]